MGCAYHALRLLPRIFRKRKHRTRLNVTIEGGLDFIDTTSAYLAQRMLSRQLSS